MKRRGLHVSKACCVRGLSSAHLLAEGPKEAKVRGGHVQLAECVAKRARVTAHALAARGQVKRLGELRRQRHLRQEGDGRREKRQDVRGEGGERDAQTP